MLREIIGFAICIAVSFAAGWVVNGWRLGEEIAQIHADYDKKRMEGEQKARAKEKEWVDKSAELERQKNAEINSANRRLNTTLAELRTRPERSSSTVPGATPACTGVSGAELARGDGEFLAGYSADAKKLAIALETCKAKYGALRE